MHTNNHILSFFNGKWTFTRIIKTNHVLYGRAEGEAVFEGSDSNCLNYYEKGKTYIVENNKFIPFQKQFLYKFNQDELTVCFGDGIDNGKIYQHYRLKPFLEQEIKSIEHHVCGNDLYESYYTITSDNEFTLMTVIKGPKKDFEITSVFLRN